MNYQRGSGAQLTEFLDKKVDLIIVDKIRSKAENLSRLISVSHSRVSRMIKASLAERNHFGLSSVEAIARKWNIPIYHYSEFLNSIEAYKDSEIEHFISASDVKKLKTPFIKVEDRSRCRDRPLVCGSEDSTNCQPLRHSLHQKD